MTTTKPKPTVSILDLPISTIIEIEREVGAKMTDWPEGVTSIADLYSRIYAAGTGKTAQEVQALSMRELVSLVRLGNEDTEDPT